MNSIGASIKKIRISKGMTQEELAEKATLNIKTIQRVENEKNPPKEKTLDLICKSLDVKKESLVTNTKVKWHAKTTKVLLNTGLVILINMVVILIFACLTFPTEATETSKIGAIILSPFLYFFILFLTQKLSREKRLMQYGLGILYYFILRIILNGFEPEWALAFTSGMAYCLLSAILVTYYGDHLIKIITIYNKTYK